MCKSLTFPKAPQISVTPLDGTVDLVTYRIAAMTYLLVYFKNWPFENPLESVCCVTLRNCIHLVGCLMLLCCVSSSEIS